MSEADFSFLRDLSESRLIPTRSSLGNFDGAELAEIAYLSLVSLRILLSEKQTASWAEAYCHKTTRASNFRAWRSDGTDLYVLIHALVDTKEHIEHDEHDYRDRMTLNPTLVHHWVSRAGTGRVSADDTHRLFSRLDTMFRIDSGSMRAVRRMVQDWPELSLDDRRLTMTRLLQLMRARARKSELLPQLEIAARHSRLEMTGVCNVETGDGCDDDDGPDEPRALTGRNGGGLLAKLAGAGIGFAMGMHSSLKKHTSESATAGATSAASVAAVATPLGGIGVGFDPDGHERSVYGKPTSTVIRRGKPPSGK